MNKFLIVLTSLLLLAVIYQQTQIQGLRGDLDSGTLDLKAASLTLIDGQGQSKVEMQADRGDGRSTIEFPTHKGSSLLLSSDAEGRPEIQLSQNGTNIARLGGGKYDEGMLTVLDSLLGTYREVAAYIPEPWPTETIIPEVPLLEAPLESYSVLLPATYSHDTPHPVFFFFDARGEPASVMSTYGPALAELGYIVVVSNGYSGGTKGPFFLMSRLERDVRQRFAVSMNEYTLSGFSWGGGGSLAPWGILFGGKLN